jgi:hypothetical protein
VARAKRASAARRWRHPLVWLFLPPVAVVIVAVLVNRVSRPLLPTSFGATGRCYYLRSPNEATELTGAGLCRAGSTPALIPESWLARYYAFYSSRYYVGTFVSPHDEAGYRTYMQSFDDEYAGEISQEAPTAVYWNGSADETAAEAGVSSDGTSMTSDGSSGGYFGDTGDSGVSGDGGSGGGDGGGGDSGGDGGGGGD